MSLADLAAELPDEKKREIASRVFKNYELDEDSRKDWLAMHAGWINLFNQQDEPKFEAWPGASKETVPMLVEACEQFHARAVTSLFPSRNVVTAIPTLKQDPESTERAKRVGKHMSWQLMVRDRGYKADKDRLLLGLPLHGSFFTKTYFHPLLGRNVVENVRPEDLVIPYGVGPREIDQIERKTQLVWQTENEAKILQAAGFYSDLPQVYKGEKTPTQDASDKSQGVTESLESDLCSVLEQHCVIDLDEDGIAEPYIAWVCRHSKKLLRLAIRYETEVDPMTGQEVPTDSKRPTEYFTHYCYMPNPEGFYGLGLGHMVGPLNKAVNKLLRQLIDAATLANIGNLSGFMSDLLGIRGGEITFEMGKFPKVPATVDDIRKGIFQFQFPAPNQTLVAAIQLLMSRSDRLASVTELTTGQPSKVYQPTAAMALIEQAQQVYNAVYQRVLNAWESELSKYARLNFKHMPDVQGFAMQAADGAIESDAVKRDDYADDLMIVPIADPKQTSKEQRIAKAQLEMQTALSYPMQNPMSIYLVYKRFFEAIEAQAIDQILPPPTPPREDDPYKENAAAFMPEPMIPPAYPDQDHMGHILAHKELVDGKEGQEGYTGQLKPEGKKALEDHIQMHIALMYEAEHGTGQLPQGVPGEMGQAGAMDLGSLLGGLGEMQGAAPNGAMGP